MTRKIVRKIAAVGVFAAAALTPTAALADDELYFINLGNGYCGYAMCGDYGCYLIDTFPCPNEVSGG